MEKVIRDGKVAVLISHGYGAGWYTWNLDHKELLFHPKLVEMVEQGRKNELTDVWVKDNLGIEMYTGGKDGLTIHWLPEGTAFVVDEHDGSESLTLLEHLTLIA